MFLPLMFLLQQAPTLTVTFAPTPVPKAIAILSKASGRRLESAPALADEVVLARLRDASTDTALAHLAESLCAKWVSRPGGVLMLTPDPAAERKLEEKAEAERAEDFQAGLTYIKKRLAEEPKELDSAAVKATAAKKAQERQRAEIAQANDDLDHMFQGGSAEEESPAWRATAQLALLMDVKGLLNAPYDAREVWAENPTPMQHAFPEGSDAILARYRRELTLTNPTATVSRVKITVEHQGELYALFSAVDPAGKRLDREIVGLSSRLTWTKLPASERFPSPGNDSPVELPVEAREARIALVQPFAYRKPDLPAIIQKCRPLFLDPVKFEPTQWHGGQDLILAAEATGKNLIGTVGDNINGRFFLAGARFAGGLKPRPSQILANHKDDFMPASDGWLVVRSKEWRYRWSRSKAKSYLDQGVRVGGITVDAAAEWANQSTDANPVFDWMWDYLQVLFSGPGSFNSAWDGTALKLWASIGPANIEALRRGRTLRLSTLPPDAQTRIAQGVFWYQWLDDRSIDPTDALPNGIADGTVSMTVTESPVMHGSPGEDDPRQSIDPITPENIGGSQATHEPYFGTIQKWQLGVHRVFDLHFALNPGKIPMTVSLDESIFDPNGQILSTLPDSVLAEIAKAKQYALAHPRPVGESPTGIPPVKKAVPPP